MHSIYQKAELTASERLLMDAITQLSQRQMFLESILRKHLPMAGYEMNFGSVERIVDPENYDYVDLLIENGSHSTKAYRENSGPVFELPYRRFAMSKAAQTEKLDRRLVERFNQNSQIESVGQYYTRSQLLRVFGDMVVDGASHDKLPNDPSVPVWRVYRHDGKLSAYLYQENRMVVTEELVWQGLDTDILPEGEIEFKDYCGTSVSPVGVYLSLEAAWVTNVAWKYIDPKVRRNAIVKLFESSGVTFDDENEVTMTDIDNLNYRFVDVYKLAEQGHFHDVYPDESGAPQTLRLAIVVEDDLYLFRYERWSAGSRYSSIKPVGDRLVPKTVLHRFHEIMAGEKTIELIEELRIKERLAAEEAKAAE